MNNTVASITALSLLIAFAGPARAGAAQGRKLYEQAKCAACHASIVGGDGSRIYTRAQRKVHNPAELKRQVRRCDTNLGLRWFDDQVGDVAAYLNTTYYHFKE